MIGTLPNGVNATLVDDGAGMVTLVINRIKLPQWTGGVSGVWDTTTLNWFDSYNLANTTYDDGSPLWFDDSATGPTAITLDTVVAPSEILERPRSSVAPLRSTRSPTRAAPARSARLLPTPPTWCSAGPPSSTTALPPPPTAA